MAREYADLDSLIASRRRVEVDDSRFDVAKALEKLGIDYRENHGELEARCPAHAPDLRASWSIASRGSNRSKHNCFSCGFGGTLWQLVAHARGFAGDADDGAARAVEWLLREVEEDRPPPLWERGVVKLVSSSRPEFRFPEGVVVAPARHWVDAALDYLVADRGVPEWQIDRWRLGYAVDGLLAGRIVLPVRDYTGALASYTARDFTGNSPRKYLNARKKDGPDFSVVFGEEAWPPVGEERRSKSVYLCEGGLNALAVERASYGEPVAAIFGSNVTEEHVGALSTFGEVVLVTDPDASGDKAARDVATGVSRHTRVSRVALDPGTDAAELPEEELRERIAGR